MGFGLVITWVSDMVVSIGAYSDEFDIFWVVNS